MPSVMFSVIQGRVPGPPTPAGHRAARSAKSTRSSSPEMPAFSWPPVRLATILPRSTVLAWSGRGTSSTRCTRSTAAVSDPSASARAPISGTLPAAMRRYPAPTRACTFTCAGTRSAPTVAVADTTTGASSACSAASPGASPASRAGTIGVRCACTSVLPPPAGSVACRVTCRRWMPSASVRSAFASAPPWSRRTRSSPTSPARQVAPSWRSSTDSSASRTRTWRICAQRAASVLWSVSAGCASWCSSAATSPSPLAAVSPLAGGAAASPSRPRSMLTRPSSLRLARTRTPSSSTARGTTRPSTSQPADSDTSARGTSAMRAPAASSSATPVSWISSGESTPCVNPSQASAALPITRVGGPPAALASACTRRVSQPISSGPCASRQAKAPPASTATKASPISARSRKCTVRPVRWTAGRSPRCTAWLSVRRSA